MMLFKAIMVGLGFRAMQDLPNQAVHDARNTRAALMAGHARIVRLSAAGDMAAVAGLQDVAQATADRQSEIRDGLEDIARRLV